MKFISFATSALQTGSTWAVAACMAAAVLGAPAAHAERADRDKPANILWDRSDGDDLKQVHIYSGNVVLTKGTIVIRCDQLTLQQTPEGYQHATAVMQQAGGLVFFRQKREGVDEFIEGQAERVEYDEKTNSVKLFNHAVVKRLRAGVDADQMTGKTIDYNTETEHYSANGGPETALPGSQPAGDNRGRTIIQPAPKKDAAPRPPVDLKPTTELQNKTSE